MTKKLELTYYIQDTYRKTEKEVSWSIFKDYFPEAKREEIDKGLTADNLVFIGWSEEK